MEGLEREPGVSQYSPPLSGQYHSSEGGGGSQVAVAEALRVQV